MIIGAGIFRAPASVAQYLPSAPLMLSAWVIGAVLSLAGGLAAAELGVRYPRSGGQYVFLREAFGPAVAFAFGWTWTIVSKPSVLAGGATIFALYFSSLVGLGTRSQKPLAVGALALLTFVNCLGVKSGTRTQNLFTAAKAAGLAALGIVAFASGRGDWSHFAGTEGGTGGDAHSLPVALALGLITILYAYDGWFDLTYTAGEVREPGRVLPRAILLGTAACAGLYLLANAAYIYLIAPAEMAGLENIAVVAFERAFGPAGGSALAALVVISTLGIVNGSILTGVRVPYAMARDGLLFSPLGRVHPRTLSPVNALAVQGSLSAVIVLFAEGFKEIASLFVSTTWFFYAVTLLGLLVLQRRERRTGAPPGTSGEGYRMPLSPWPAVLFVVVTLFIIGSDLFFGGPRVLAGLGIALAGVPVYWVWRGVRK